MCLAFNCLIYRLARIAAQNRLSVIQNSSIFISGNFIQSLLGLMISAQDRYEQWQQASHQSFWFEHELNELLWLVQMMGREDAAIYVYEQLLNADAENIAAGKPTPEIDERLNSMIWRSYTWILAAYELIRTIAQRLKMAVGNADLYEQAKDVRDQFARLRVPLAKFEPVKKHPSDLPFPRGCVQPGRGLCWLVSSDQIISRMELSDQLLVLLHALKHREK